MFVGVDYLKSLIPLGSGKMSSLEVLRSNLHSCMHACSRFRHNMQYSLFPKGEGWPVPRIRYSKVGHL
jgi:hypothetical protein